jgi:hypothetical protein
MSRTTPVTVLGLAVLASACSACFTTQRLTRPPEPLVVEAGRFPHEVLDGVLRKVVDDRGRVDYKALAADRGPLERYLWAVSEHSPHSHPELFPSEADKLAYWINAYNAYVLYAVTERPTMRSVNDDKTDFFYFTEYTLGGASMSLYALENDVVRKEHAEPRIHFALNCASGGCPELPAEAFLPATLEAQLAREATEFCAHPDKVRAAAGVVEMSSIFDWYADDFVGSGGPVAFCRKWGNTTLPAGAKPAFLPYDWALNAQPGKALFE